jgi:hypothetical protein
MYAADTFSKPLPEFNEDMIRIFGDPNNPSAPEIRTVEAMEEAIRTLYKFRVDMQLDEATDDEMPQIDQEEYSMCSANTQ